MILLIALMGGIFAVLSFIHFFVDWIFQKCKSQDKVKDYEHR